MGIKSDDKPVCCVFSTSCVEIDICQDAKITVDKCYSTGSKTVIWPIGLLNFVFLNYRI